MRRHKRPDPVEALAVQVHGQATVALFFDKLVSAAIPDLDGPGSVLTRRDGPLEVRIVERMILDVHGKMAFPTPKRDSFRDRPARQRAVSLEPKVVVQSPRGMALNDEPSVTLPYSRLSERLGRLTSLATPSILVEAHLWIVA